MIKGPDNRDQVLSLALNAKCKGTGSVYTEHLPFEIADLVLAEFSDGDVEINIYAFELEKVKARDVAAFIVRQLLTAHGEIKVPGQL